MKAIALRAAIDHKPRAADSVPVDLPDPVCQDGGVLARVIDLSLDPYVGSHIRGRHMGEAPPKPMQDAIPGALVAQVIESRTENIKSGDFVHSMRGGWQEIVALPVGQSRKVDVSRTGTGAHAGVLGMPGLTA